jgi:hypothetical protein
MTHDQISPIATQSQSVISRVNGRQGGCRGGSRFLIQWRSTGYRANSQRYDASSQSMDFDIARKT